MKKGQAWEVLGEKSCVENCHEMLITSTESLIRPLAEPPERQIDRRPSGWGCYNCLLGFIPMLDPASLSAGDKAVAGIRRVGIWTMCSVMLLLGCSDRQKQHWVMDNIADEGCENVASQENVDHSHVSDHPRSDGTPPTILGQRSSGLQVQASFARPSTGEIAAAAFVERKLVVRELNELEEYEFPGQSKASLGRVIEEIRSLTSKQSIRAVVFESSHKHGVGDGRAVNALAKVCVEVNCDLFVDYPVGGGVIHADSILELFDWIVVRQ